MILVTSSALVLYLFTILDPLHEHFLWPFTSPVLPVRDDPRPARGARAQGEPHSFVLRPRARVDVTVGHASCLARPRPGGLRLDGGVRLLRPPLLERATNAWEEQ